MSREAIAQYSVLTAFDERGITFIPNWLVHALDPVRRTVVFDDMSEMANDLLLGIFQNTFYPLFPPPDQAIIRVVCLPGRSTIGIPSNPRVTAGSSSSPPLDRSPDPC